MLPPETLRENPLRARIYYNDARFDDLVRSIRLCGILEPLTVCAQDDGYMIVSGERRWRAAVTLGYRSVPCVLIRADADRAMVSDLTNHLNHDPLSYFEIAACYERLRDRFGLTYEETAARLGVSPGEIREKVKLLQIPPHLRRKILENGLSESYARLLLRHTDAEKDLLLGKITEQRLTLTQAKEESDALLHKPGPRPGRIRAFYTGVTVFVNTIDRACAAMRDGGVDAQIEKDENDERVEYRISIPKRRTS